MNFFLIKNVLFLQIGVRKEEKLCTSSLSRDTTFIVQASYCHRASGIEPGHVHHGVVKPAGSPHAWGWKGL